MPDDAPPRTAERYTAVSTLLAMTLRACRTTALTIRAGYGTEGLASVRRLFEAAGHAQRVAEDASGQYADNWLRGRGKADKPRVAFGQPEDDPLWGLMSGQAHATFEVYARLSAEFDGRRLVHSVAPRRDVFWDSIWLWVVARQLSRVLAALIKVHPHIETADFLAVSERLIAAETQIETEIAAHQAARPS